MDTNKKVIIDSEKFLKKRKYIEFYNLLENLNEIEFYFTNDSYFYNNNAGFKKSNKIHQYFIFFEENN